MQGYHGCAIGVVVIGGGTAGVIAALQAARAGVRTAIVEMAGQLGGTMTTGGVSAPRLTSSAPIDRSSLRSAGAGQSDRKPSIIPPGPT